MPKAKSPAAAPVRAKAAPKKAARADVTAPKKAVRTTVKKKSKKVIVDVIADEPVLAAETLAAENFTRRRLDDQAPSHLSPREVKAERAGEDLDSQKKFFSSYVAAAAADKKDHRQAKKPESGAKSLNLYRRLVVKFIIFTALLLAVVLYFSLAKLTVVIVPQGENLDDSLLLRVSSAPALNAGVTTATTTASTTAASAPSENLNTAMSQPVSGTVQSLDVSAAKTYPATGEDFAGEQISGQVIIVNHYIKGQTLVATTRLLSPDNKLFRLKNAVTIPAGANAYAAIYADKPAEDLAIGPTTFTIPGLWAGLQDKIYAHSETAFTFDRAIKKYVKPSDLQAAATDIKDALLAQAKNNLGAGDWLYDMSAPATITVDAKANDQKDQFTVTAQEKVVAISFDKAEAAKLAAAKLNLLIPDDKELAAFDPASIEYSLDNYDPLSNTAIIKANFSGTMILKNDAEIINRKQLVNLTKDQLDIYLKALPEVKSYQLKFFPGFIKKAPSLADRIKVEIKK